MFYVIERPKQCPTDMTRSTWAVCWVYPGEKHASYPEAVRIAGLLDDKYPDLEHDVRTIPEAAITKTFPRIDTRFRPPSNDQH